MNHGTESYLPPNTRSTVGAMVLIGPVRMQTGGFNSTVADQDQFDRLVLNTSITPLQVGV